MECIFCGKKLIASKKFIEHNDTVECSNCKNSFKFIADNVKQSPPEEFDNKITAMFFLLRIFIAALVCSIYYYNYPIVNSSMILFFAVNIFPLLTITIINLFYKKRMPDFSLLFKDKYFNTFLFWICLAEIITVISLNLIFFVIY